MPDVLVSSPTQELLHPETRVDHTRHNALTRITATVPHNRWTEGGRIDARVKSNIYADDDINYEYTGKLYPTATVHAVYGRRYIGEGHDIRVEKCELDTLTEINEVIATEVLTGERTHIPRAIIPPEPTKELSPANNDFWLDQIGNHNTWPIMLMGKVIPNQLDADGKAAMDGEDLEANSHDEEDYHLGNMALFPAEMQDELSEAARHTLEFRKKNGRDSRFKDIQVPGDPDESYSAQDPLSYNLRGGPTDSTARGGINVIDDISDDPSYMGLLSSLVNMTEAQARATMEEYITITSGIRSGEIRDDGNGSDEDREKFQAAGAVDNQRRMIVDITNFNIRHREGRRITPEEAQVAEDRYLQGILRVATKIRGDQAA